jgi:PadR family transcriptional regulator, regulatory protein AphA
MSLDHAMLGFLSYAPRSGYDLNKMFNRSVQHFWPATQSQIYRTLKRMADDGWVTVEVIDQDGRPDRKVYHLTPEGEAELQRWMCSGPAPTPNRNAWMIQIFFCHQLSNEEIIGLFERRAAGVRGYRDALLAQAGQDLPAGREEIGMERAARLWELTLDNGLAHLDCELEWIERTLEALRQLPEA